MNFSCKILKTTRIKKKCAFHALLKDVGREECSSCINKEVLALGRNPFLQNINAALKQVFHIITSTLKKKKNEFYSPTKEGTKATRIISTTKMPAE